MRKADVERLPCPFCGSTRIAIDREERDGYAEYPDDPDRWAYYGFCTTCACQGPWNKTSREAAVAAWNRRVSREAVERFRAALG